MRQVDPRYMGDKVGCYPTSPSRGIQYTNKIATNKGPQTNSIICFATQTRLNMQVWSWSTMQTLPTAPK